MRARISPAVVPAAASLALHTGLLLLVLTVTLTVTTRTQPGSGESGPSISLAEPSTDPIRVDDRRRPWSGPSTPFEPPPPTVRRPRSELGRIARPIDSVDLRAGAAPDERRPLEQLKSPEFAVGRGATFAGMKATRAASVVYVVDTSGAMVNSLSFVLGELRRSIDRLSVRQSFQVVLFGLGDDGPFETLPGRETLVLASPSERDRADMWLDSVFAGGRSNPLDGLRRALEYRPDVVFLLSRSIRRTGVGAQWGRGREAILAELDRLNPIDERTGRRPVVIKTIQFIDEDPSGIMRSIGELHGDPADPQSHAVLTLGELVERSSEPDPVLIETPELDQAAAVLAELAADGADTAVLFGVPRDDQRFAVAKAASRAAALLEQAELRGVPEQDRDVRLPFLRARTCVLLGAVSDQDDRRRGLSETAVSMLEGISLESALLERARVVSLGSALLLRSAEGDRVRAHALFGGLTDGDAEHTDVDPVTYAEAWFGLVFSAPDADRARVAATRLREAMRRSPFVLDGRADPALIVAACDAVARGLVEMNDDRLLVEAFAPLIELLDDEGIGLDARTRRALVFHRISALTDDDTPFEELPAVVSFSRAAVLSADFARHGEAIRLFDIAADRAEDDALRIEALWESAVLLIESSDPDSNLGAAARLRRLAGVDPGSERALDAILASLDLARAYDDAERARGPYLETLGYALDAFPTLPARNAWLLECARLHLINGEIPPALGRLAEIDPNTPEGVSGGRIFVEVSAKSLDELAERLEAQRSSSGPVDSDVLVLYADIAERAAGFARMRELPEADRFAADHADAMLESGEPGARSLYEGLLERGAEVPGGRVRLRLGLARALRRAGQDRRAFEELRGLTELLEHADPRPTSFWHAWTLTLELLAENGGSGTSADRIEAHAARLRSLDPELGGEPWRSRIERAAK